MAGCIPLLAEGQTLPIQLRVAKTSSKTPLSVISNESPPNTRWLRQWEHGEGTGGGACRENVCAAVTPYLKTWNLISYTYIVLVCFDQSAKQWQSKMTECHG